MLNRIYAVRDTDTGKLVSNITSPHRTYWERKGCAQNAIINYSQRTVKPKHGKLELVCFELVEVKNETD